MTPPVSASILAYDHRRVCQVLRRLEITLEEVALCLLISRSFEQ